MEVVESIDQFVIRTIAALCEMEDSEITLASTLGELGMDSLRITAFCAHIQATHGCEVTSDDTFALLEAPEVANVVAVVRNMTERARFECLTAS